MVPYALEIQISVNLFTRGSFWRNYPEISKSLYFWRNLALELKGRLWFALLSGLLDLYVQQVILVSNQIPRYLWLSSTRLWNLLWRSWLGIFSSWFPVGSPLFFHQLVLGVAISTSDLPSGEMFATQCFCCHNHCCVVSESDYCYTWR